MPQPKVQKFIAGGLMYILLFAAGSENIGGHDNDTKCGGEDRWPQKVLIDPLAKNINQKPKPATIEQLNAINTTVDSNRYAEAKPRMTIEQQVYSIKGCYISDVLRENDNDLHLVIEDGKGHHMIAEIPDTKCSEAAKSAWSGNMDVARDTMLYYAENYRRYLFTVTGVAFVDKAHGQTGKADNNVEIHPILSLKTEQRINPILK